MLLVMLLVISVIILSMFIIAVLLLMIHGPKFLTRPDFPIILYQVRKIYRENNLTWNSAKDSCVKRVLGDTLDIDTSTVEVCGEYSEDIDHINNYVISGLDYYGPYVRSYPLTVDSLKEFTQQDFAKIRYFVHRKEKLAGEGISPDTMTILILLQEECKDFSFV